MPASRSALACIASALCVCALAQDDLATVTNGVTSLEPLARHPQTSRKVVDWLRSAHFIRKPVDDATSSDTFDHYIEMLDPRRARFLAADIQDLERYRYELDDALKAGRLEPAFEIYNRFRERTVDRLEYALARLEQGIDTFDFSLEETIEIDRTDAPWPAGDVEANDLWRQQLKGTVLNMRLAGRDDAEIEESLTKQYRTRLRRARQVKSEDAFQAYVNAFAATYDRHTQYFSPRNYENFSINMSLSLEGIGAVLRAEEEYTAVEKLVTAGPADKSGALKPDDRIVAVGQGEKGTLIDVVGMRLDDVVEMIRGPKDSVVRLQVVRDDAGGSSTEDRVVAITRNTVKLEEQSAKSRVLTVEDGPLNRRIGVIEVPTFYIDFKGRQEGKRDYRSTTRDVRRLIGDLKVEGVEGIIVDLRNNGGGSLEEASTLTGLFIPDGPTVQVKMARSRTRVQHDEDKGYVAWDGPLAVLVNRFSASASEIFAGAIQDYGRGIVTGNRTFGKGTVQTLIELDRGQLKLTQAKFYRVTGQSPQAHGVAPDIAFPEFPFLRVDEDDDNFGWDRVDPVRYAGDDTIHSVLGALRQRHSQRTDSDAEFNYMRARVDRNRELDERTHISLNDVERKTQKIADDAWTLSLENSLLEARGEPPAASLKELRERQEAAVENGESPPDPLLDETASILADYIGLTRQVAMAQGAPRTVVQ